MKKIISIIALVLLSKAAWADGIVTKTLFVSPDTSTTIDEHHPSYRIPSIVKTKSGMLVAICDERRSTNGSDIGAGRIDLVCKTSNDNGKTWSEAKTIGSGYGINGYGDAAAVCDSHTGDILIMCAGGSIGYHGSKVSNGPDGINVDKALRVFRITGKVKGKTIRWSAPVDMTSNIYGLYAHRSGDYANYVTRAFFGSGRLCQSKTKGDGKSRRIYGALATNRGSLVVYTDDMGRSWNCLGKASDQPAVAGDEAKVEELPNGDVLLNCRVGGGRIFNIYKYATGTWAEAATLDISAPACNGEILILPNGNAYTMLLSVPTGGARKDVSIFSKALEYKPNYDVSEFTDASKWDKLQLSTTTSAYSTMVQDADGNIAFLYEENNKPHFHETYDIVFKSLPRSVIVSRTQTKVRPGCCIE